MKMNMNVDGLRKAFSSRKFITMVFMVSGTYGVYGFGFAPPDGVTMALIGLVSVYLGGQAWVDSNTLDKV